MSPARAPLSLVPVTLAHRHALQQGPQALAAMLGVAVPAGWPHFGHAFDPARQPEPTPDALRWASFLFLTEATLVGNGGFKGPPDAEGVVEIGYEIAAPLHNQGWATAAVGQLLAMAFAEAQVQVVKAHTLAEGNASNAVLKKVGMQWAGELPNEHVGAVWQWRLKRADWQALASERASQ